jgi:uncharacterized coiled-coil protein SlyX
MTDSNLDQRLAALESRLDRLEMLIRTLTDAVSGPAADLAQARAGIQAWVTDYVSLRLQQLVPETCEHDGAAAGADSTGPMLPGTRIRCTDEVLHRLGRIPIPFVRQMVTDKVAETARAENVAVVDVGFFERSATF